MEEDAIRGETTLIFSFHQIYGGKKTNPFIAPSGDSEKKMTKRYDQVGGVSGSLNGPPS